MQRVTITIDDELDAELDRFMGARGYDNRSEAIRDLARQVRTEAQPAHVSGQDCRHGESGGPEYQGQHARP